MVGLHANAWTATGNVSHGLWTLPVALEVCYPRPDPGGPHTRANRDANAAPRLRVSAHPESLTMSLHCIPFRGVVIAASMASLSVFTDGSITDMGFSGYFESVETILTPPTCESCGWDACQLSLGFLL